jgi:hypothetical protein
VPFSEQGSWNELPDTENTYLDSVGYAENNLGGMEIAINPIWLIT